MIFNITYLRSSQAYLTREIKSLKMNAGGANTSTLDSSALSEFGQNDVLFGLPAVTFEEIDAFAAKLTKENVPFVW